MPGGFTHALVLLAQQGLSDAEPALPPATHGYGAQLFQSLVALVAVCAVAWVVLRWAAQKGLGQLARGRHVSVRERVALDAKRSVYLVQVGTRVLLLGGGEQGVSLLVELRPEDLAQSDASAAGGAGGEASGAKRFHEVLARIRGKRDDEPDRE